MVWFAAGGRKEKGEGRKKGTKDERKKEREKRERATHKHVVFCQKYPVKSKKVLSKVKKTTRTVVSANICTYLRTYICTHTHLLEAVIHRYIRNKKRGEGALCTAYN